MHAWESIQATVDLIETTITEERTIEELAKVANLSPFYYQRLFKRLVGKPVMEYIKLRRLAQAADYLNSHQDKIVDVAMKYGFENHETFTRAFKAAYGMTPESYKSDPVPLNKFLKPDLLLNYVMVDENVPLVVDDIVLEIQRRTIEEAQTFVGLSRKVPKAQAMMGATGVDIPGQVWGEFHERKKNIKQINPDLEELGASFMDTEEDDKFIYFAGAKAVDGTSIDESLTAWKLDKGEYIVCCIEADSKEKLVTVALDKANGYLYGTWMPTHKIMIKPFSAEKYFPTKDEIHYMEIWLAVMP